MPTGLTSTIFPTRSGYRVASSIAIHPPSESPTTSGASSPSSSHMSSRWKTASSMPSIWSIPSDSPKPGNTGTVTANESASSSSAGFVASPPAECRYTRGSPDPARNTWILPRGASTRSSVSVCGIRLRHRRLRAVHRRAVGELGSQLRHDLLGEQCHVLPSQVVGEAAELEQPEQVSRPQRAERVDELLGDGLGRTDDRVPPVDDLVPRLHVEHERAGRFEDARER